MLVEDGIVVARGLDLRAEHVTEHVDHGGRLLIPAFVDAHCHVLATGLDLMKLHLGTAHTCEAVLDLVWERHRSDRAGWLVAVHYDQNRYGRHLTRTELDGISMERPILLRHVSGHAGVANSGALLAAGITETVEDPEGGSFGRDESGRLNGVLRERAFEMVLDASPKPSLEEMVNAILEAGKSMRRWGIASASDLLTGRFDLFMELEAYRLAAEQGCQVSTRLYIQWSRLFGPKRIDPDRFKELAAGFDSKTCRVAGVKIFADGAIGAGTAAMNEAYPGVKPDSKRAHGTLIYNPERLKAMIHEAAAAGWQVAVHSIGDRATDLVMDAFETATETRRHRLEHAIVLSNEQIERLARIGCHVTFQPEFLLRFGETYASRLGPKRAERLMRSRSVLDAGVRLSFSSDRPITSGNPWEAIGAATSRPHGFDQAENCTRIEAVEAYTVRSAEANEDEKWIGTLQPGSKAEFQTIDSDGL
jgi:hypothetical protein